MKILWSWLTSFLTHLEVSPEEAVQALTLSGTETYEEAAYAWARPFEVVLVEEVHNHPHSDRLHLCKVRTAQDKSYTVVCGAHNVRPGLKSLLALPGSFLPGKNEPLTPCIIRGIASEAMLCSAEELCISDLWPGEGIMEVPQTVTIGTSLQSLLPKDVLLTLEVTPNRGDLLSYKGVARELHTLGRAFFNQSTFFNTEIHPQGKSLFSSVDRVLCQHYHLASFKGSPLHRTSCLMRRRLVSMGINLHFPWVDLTNYLSEELGQPLHVFDEEALLGPLSVRLSKKGEVFQGLNDQTYLLPDGLPLVCDSEGIVALAGVMGGKRGACHKESRSVLVEAAVFCPGPVALAGQATKIISQARTRFERNVDPEGLYYVLSTVQQWAQNHEWMMDGYTSLRFPSVVPTLPLIPELFPRLTGITLKERDIVDQCKRAGATIIPLGDTHYDLVPPSFRHDWTLPQHTVEEVLRVKGYEQVKAQPLKFHEIKPTEEEELLQEASRYLVNQGLYEVLTWSFISKDYSNIFSRSSSSPEISLLNPLSPDQSVMRSSLLPSFLDLLTYHRHHHVSFEPIFEIAPCYFSLNHQETVIGGLIPPEMPHQWHQGKPVQSSFYQGRNLVHALLSVLGRMNKMVWRAGGPSWYHPGQCAELGYEDEEGAWKILAEVGVLHPRFANRGWDKSVGFEIFPERSKKGEKSCYKATHLQPVTKDLSFFISSSCEIGPLIKSMTEGLEPVLKNVDVTDLFMDDTKNIRSLTIRAYFQPQEACFSSSDLHSFMEHMVRKAESHGALLRGKL